MTNRNSDSPNIAYFAMRRTPDGEGHIGAALVVDGKGIPQEFRCTVPVRPSATQIAIYGATLRPLITFDLCGKMLLSSLTTGPVACLVESESELDLQEYVSVPVFHVHRTAMLDRNSRLEPSIYERRGRSKNEGSNGMPGEHIQLDSTASFAPVFVKCLPEQQKGLENLLPMLQTLFGFVDLVEPFERITSGCRVLGERDNRFA